MTNEEFDNGLRGLITQAQRDAAALDEARDRMRYVHEAINEAATGLDMLKAAKEMLLGKLIEHHRIPDEKYGGYTGVDQEDPFPRIAQRMEGMREEMRRTYFPDPARGYYPEEAAE